MESTLNWMGRIAVKWLAKLMFTIDMVEHADLPAGPKIIAANHPSTTDPFVVLGLARARSRVLIRDVLFNVPVFGQYLNAAGHICVETGNGRPAFDAALRSLERGETVIIFPEGDISPLVGGLNQAHTGVARLALQSGAPVIPLGIGLDRRRIRLVESIVEGKMELGTWYLGGPYAFTSGKPMYITGSLEDRNHMRDMAAQIMDNIADLAHESYQRLSKRWRGIPGLASV